LTPGDTSHSSQGPAPPVPRWEVGFTLTALFLLTGAALPLLRLEEGATVLDGDPFSQAIHGAIYGVALVLLLRGGGGYNALAQLPLALWALVTLVVFSASWSDDPGLTARRGGALLGTTAVGLYFGLRYQLEEQLRLIVGVLAFAAALSVLFAVGTSVGIMEGAHDGAWRGVFMHKNVLGRMMALLAVASLTRALAGGLNPVAWACFAAGTVLVVFSESRTALAVYLGALAAFPVLRTVRIRYTLAVPILLATLSTVFGGLLWAMNELDGISSAVGRDITLTGRTFLWQSSAELLLERPWLGYGYAAFWRGWDGPSAAVWSATLWQPPHAHNGMLDLGLDLGIVGMTLFVAAFMVVGSVAFRHARVGDGVIRFWPLVFLCFFVMVNATETAIMRQNNLLWVLFVAIAVAVPEEVRSRARQPGVRRWRRGIVTVSRPLTGNPRLPSSAASSPA
jgi:exopolysaccharide production protein ExoQ